MSVIVRPAAQRGHAHLGWLDTRHTFSFAHYFDPDHMGYRTLRVINEDRIAPAAGFDTHGHRDMEIVTYLIDGALAHKDSTGTTEVIRRGEVQRMSAGTGIRHSEFNASPDRETHLLQIWILPEREGLAPAYEQRSFPDEEKRNRLRLLAARDPRDGALLIHQDVDIYASILQPGAGLRYELRQGRGAWVQVVSGTLAVNGTALSAGDGAAIENAVAIEFTAAGTAEFLLFDLA